MRTVLSLVSRLCLPLMLVVISLLFIQQSLQRKLRISVQQSKSRTYDHVDNGQLLLSTDLIYQKGRWGNPIVIHEYKLLFFTIPKVACTHWKLLFRRMQGQPEWNLTRDPLKLLHNPMTNNITTLDYLPLEEAQHIMTSSEWTRAVFVREPKERILSAFLNKFIEDGEYFFHKCCRKRAEYFKEQCRIKRNSSDFSYFLNRTRDCADIHWNPQYSAIDAKWWGAINFVGYIGNNVEDTKELLQSITSTKDGVSAWERYGKTGWGENGTDSFVKPNSFDTRHATSANDKLRRYYTRSDEQFVEKYWAGEWNHTVYHFSPLHLFNDNISLRRTLR